MIDRDDTAFPSHGSMGEVCHEGLSAREYAAIKLRVPDSGTDWLDAMIDKSLLNEFAGKAILGICADPHHDTSDLGGYDQMAKYAYSLAESMLKASKGE